MKKKLAAVMATALSMSMIFTGCVPSGFQVMDGDGMINENPVYQPDPVKPSDNGTDNTDINTDNTDNNNTDISTSTVDNNALIDSFINNESKAKFDHVIADEDTYYSLDEMVIARGDVILNDFFGYGGGETAPSYTVKVSYADIDCGADGIRDLGIYVNYIVNTGYEDSYDQYLGDYFILMVIDDELKCITMTEEYYRSFGDINGCGYISEGGSGGANLHVNSGRFVNADGEVVYDFYCQYYMGYVEAGIDSYCVPDDIREDVPEVQYDYEGDYATYVYNFYEGPDYPTGLTWDEDGHYDADSQKRYDRYEKEYNEWLSKNFFVFERVSDGEVFIPNDLKQFMDSNNIKYYTSKQANEVLSEHRESIGLTDTVLYGAYPQWILLYDQTAEFNEEMEKQYVGEYVDDLNDPNLQIAKGEDGKFIVQIGIYRLCFMDDGVGEFRDDGMDFVISDENGNPMEGTIIVDENGEATVTFTKSEWTYIEDGDTYTYQKTSDTPNIFVYEFDSED